MFYKYFCLPFTNKNSQRSPVKDGKHLHLMGSFEFRQVPLFFSYKIKFNLKKYAEDLKLFLLMLNKGK